MADRTLTIRGVADAVLERLRARADANRRSLNGEVLAILDRAAAAGTTASLPSHAAPHTTPPHSIVREPATLAYGDATHAPAISLAHIDREALADVCGRHHIVRLAVFGSVARDDARPDSDVDVVVDFAPGMTPGFGIVRVADALRPVFGRTVDLVTRAGLATRLREPILSSAKTMYAAE
jgi:uncharacterized protein